MARAANTTLLWLFAAVPCFGCGGAEKGTAQHHESLGPLETCAEGGPIAVKGVHNRARATEHPDPEEIVRAAVHCELAAIDWQGAPPATGFSVSVTVVDVATEQNGRSTTATSHVSATVHHDKRGIVATLRGSGEARDVDGKGARAERDAIDAATRGALRRLREAVLQVQ